MAPVRLGVSLSTAVQADSPQAMAAMVVERAAAAHAAGMSSLSVGDHHAERRWYLQNTPMLGRLLAEWRDRPAGCLFLLPLWNPLLVAEHVGTLAAMLDAPFIVQTGIGVGRSQFGAMGAELSQRGADTDEAIVVIQALLAGETVSSERFDMGPVSLGLRPVQPVEWWIGGHVEATLRRAATVGTAWYAGPALSAAEGAPIVDRYRTLCQGSGRPARSIVRRDALVLSDASLARTRAAELVDAGYRNMTLDKLLVGGPEDAAAMLEADAAAGFDDVIVRCMSPDQDEALETIALLGTL